MAKHPENHRPNGTADHSIIAVEGRKSAKNNLWLAVTFFAFAAVGWALIGNGYQLRIKGWIGLLAFTFAAPSVLLAGFRAYRNPEKAEFAAKIASHGKHALSEVDLILDGSISSSRHGGLRITEKWIVYKSVDQLIAFPSCDVVWVYGIRHAGTNKVRIYNEKAELIEDYVDLSESAQVIAALLACCPNAMHGYHEGLQRRFVSKPATTATKMRQQVALGQRNAVAIDPGLQKLG
jgi:hypothetical protein